MVVLASPRLSHIFIHIYTWIYLSFLSVHLYMQVYISYSVMAILAWIVLVCDADSTIVTVKWERMKLSDTTQSITPVMSAS